MCRAREIADSLKRNNDPSKFSKAICNDMSEKNWSKNVKTNQAAYKLMMIAHSKKTERKAVDIQLSRRTPPLEPSLRTQVNEQNWPCVVIKKIDEVKGRGAFAAKDIKKGQIISDYHGEIIDQVAGDYRYDELYKDRDDNKYLLKFFYKGQYYYFDAVKHCQCHPGKTIKGRLFNNSRKDNNIQMKVRGDIDRIVLLMEASKDITAGSELLWD